MAETYLAGAVLAGAAAEAASCKVVFGRSRGQLMMVATWTVAR
jgi:hypothetical protein